MNPTNESIGRAIDPVMYNDDDLRTIAQDWDESDPIQKTAMDLAVRLLNHREATRSRAGYPARELDRQAPGEEFMRVAERLAAAGIEPGGFDPNATVTEHRAQCRRCGDFVAIAVPSAPQPPAQEQGDNLEFFTAPEGLHPGTLNLIARFAGALAAKLAEAERKYGWDTHWQSPAWMDQCREQLVDHVAKGDPRDVAAYCAFLWHHGEPTAITRAAGAEDARDADRMDWLAKNVTETLTTGSIHGEFPYPEHKTMYVLPRLIAWADFHGQVGFREAIDIAMQNAAIASQAKEGEK